MTRHAYRRLLVVLLAALVVVVGLGVWVVAPRRAAPRWPAHVVAGVYLTCARAYQSRPTCDCLTRELERVSPDPEADATASEVEAAQRACGVTSAAREEGEAI